MPLSVDTFHASVAAAAVEAGADLINDVSGGAIDAEMLPTAAALGVPIVLMHMRGDVDTMFAAGNAEYGCVWREVGAELAARVEAATSAGVPLFNLILDPGLGFSKTQRQSAELLGKLAELRSEALPGVLARLPMVVGASRKRFIGSITGGRPVWGLPVDDFLSKTLPYWLRYTHTPSNRTLWQNITHTTHINQLRP